LKNFFTILLLLFISSSNAISNEFKPAQLSKVTLNSMPLDGWRFGVGTGYAFYLGDQMDYTLTRKYGDFNKLRPNLTLAAFKQISDEKEWGLVFKTGSFQTLKSSNTHGVQCNYQEIQSVWQRSLNNNIDLNGKGVTVNLQYGFGAMYYKSKYFAVNGNFKTEDFITSSVGYGYENRTDFMGNEYTDIPNKKFAVLGNLGLNIGFRIAGNLSLYFENSIQVSTSNKLSGNLDKVSKIPPDGYFYTGLSLFYKFGKGGSRLVCPKF
jgi:hypothetical protein